MAAPADARFAGRRIAFRIAESLYSTTADEIGAAFARYIHVVSSE